MCGANGGATASSIVNLQPEGESREDREVSPFSIINEGDNKVTIIQKLHNILM